MKEVQSNGIFLLIIVLLFSLSVKLLPSKNNKNNTAANNDQSYASAFFLNESPIDQAVIYIRPLIASESIGTLAQSLNNVQLDKLLEIVDYIIENESLSFDKKLLLLYALTFNYKNDAFAQHEILNRIRIYDDLQQGMPVLLIAARSEDFIEVVPTLISWAEKQGLLDEFITQALITAIQDNDLAAVKVLKDYGLSISEEQASHALLYTVKNNKDSAFVPFLSQQGANVNLVDNGKTLLVYATENNNLAMVEALLKEKANPQKIGDATIGTPLQIAIEKGYADIDTLLRQYGAQEK